jgi:PLP dependent protein
LDGVNLKSNLEALMSRINAACLRAGRSPHEVKLIAVSKTVNTETIEAAFKLGIRHFGENRVQEAESKIEALAHLKPAAVWHMIGHLQSNKVKTSLELFDTIDSIDSIALAEAINARADRKIPVLLQVNIASEASKSGFEIAEIKQAFKKASNLPALEIKGLMTVAPIAGDPEEVRPVFRRLRELRDDFGLKDLSMGMSDDYEVAIEEGATVLRIGRALFGERVRAIEPSQIRNKR